MIIHGQNNASQKTHTMKTSDCGILTTMTGEVPPEYTKQTSNGGFRPIQKGQLNIIRVRPQVLNEQQESSRTIQSTIASGNIVGQVFKASQDNINGIALTLESAAGASIDDFESYADSAALQLVWVETTNVATLETTVVKSGSQSMKINGAILADE